MSNNNTIAAKLLQLKQIDEQNAHADRIRHEAKVALAEMLVDESKGARELLPGVEMVCGCVTEDGVGRPVRFTVSIAKVGDSPVGESRHLRGYLDDRLGGVLENSHDHVSRGRQVEPGGWFDAVAEELWRLAAHEDPPSVW